MRLISLCPIKFPIHFSPPRKSPNIGICRSNSQKPRKHSKFEHLHRNARHMPKFQIFAQKPAKTGIFDQSAFGEKPNVTEALFHWKQKFSGEKMKIGKNRPFCPAGKNTRLGVNKKAGACYSEWSVSGMKNSMPECLTEVIENKGRTNTLYLHAARSDKLISHKRSSFLFWFILREIQISTHTILYTTYILDRHKFTYIILYCIYLRILKYMSF